MMLLRWGLPLRCGLAVSGWLALGATTELPDGAILRVLVTAVFLLVCPGLAAARWARPAWSRDVGWAGFLEVAVLSVVLSLVLAVLAAESFYLSSAFTTARVMTALAVITSCLALLPRRGEARPRAARAASDDGPPAPATGGPQPPAPEPEAPSAPRASRNAGSAARGGRAVGGAARRGGRIPVAARFVAGGLTLGLGLVTAASAARNRR